MPSWKKLILSGSDATLNSVNVTDDVAISGSLIISGSSTQPLTIQTLPEQDIQYVVTYDIANGKLGYVNATSGTSGIAGSNGTEIGRAHV
jgi:hypothetical protein